MSGGPGDDVSRGGGGNDLIYANRGVDETFGGDGDDNLWALARADVTGPADAEGDTLHGENGDDRFHTRDGEVDKIDCGPDNDGARLDNVDVIVDATPTAPNGSCERVVRRPEGARRRSGERDREPAGGLAAG
jgi:hypothetical protein